MSMSHKITKKPHSDEKDRFPLPNWIGNPPEGSHLDCSKGDKLLQKLFIDELPVYYFGRNVDFCEIPVEHASCSRVHAVIVFHKLLKRFALVDLKSSHGTFVSGTRINPLTPIFLDIGTEFYFGASTRRFKVREKYEAKIETSNENSINDSKNVVKHILPEDEEELDHLTEYNTAQNRRIPVIEQTSEEAKVKKKPRAKITFAKEETIVNLDDPAQGVFQNLVQTAIIPRKRKLTDGDFDFPSLQSRPKVSLRKLTGDEPEEDEFSNILGVKMNSAPDLDNMDVYGPKPMEEEPHHKKYVKEVWPGRKPTHIV